MIYCYLIRLHLEKVRQAVKDGKENAQTKKNKALVNTQEVINDLNNKLVASQTEVSVNYLQVDCYSTTAGTINNTHPTHVQSTSFILF